MPSEKHSTDIKPGSKWLAYVRDSGHEKQQTSCDQQEAVIRQVLAEAGATLARAPYRDEARKGSSMEGRNELARLLAEAVPGVADGVMFWSSARMARDANDANIIRATLRKRGYQLYFIADNLPNIGAWNPLLEVVQDLANAQYLEKLSLEIKRGHDLILAAGLIPGGQAPKGYASEQVSYRTDRDGKARTAMRWVRDPATAARVQLAWNMRLAGYGLRAIGEATALYANHKRLSKMFRNPIYKGTLEFGERTLPNFVEAYVTPAEWDRVQAMSEERRSVHPRHLANTWLLRGLVCCAYCDGPMQGKCNHVKRQGRRGVLEYFNNYYICPNHFTYANRCPAFSVPADDLELAVLEAVEKTYLNGDVLQEQYALWQSATAEDAAAAAETAELRVKLGELNRRIANLLDQAEAGSSVGARLAEREAEREAATCRLRELESRPVTVLLPPAQAQEIVGLLRQAYKDGDRETARLRLSKFVLKVVAAWDRPPVVTLRPPLGLP